MLYISLRQYLYIVAVADAGSLTKAASGLHVSQPSLSVAISRVEARLDRVIFHRGKGAAISLTPFGYRFVAQARALLRDAEAVEGMAQMATPFVLGCFEDISPWYLPSTVAELRQKWPEHTFEWAERRFAGLSNDLREDRINLAITYDVGFDDDFDRLPIKAVAPVAFVSPYSPLASLTSVDLVELARHPLILSTDKVSLRFIEDLFAQLQLEPIIGHTTKSLEMMRSLAAHGAGVGISYSNPQTAQSYDGHPLITIPITTPEALAEIVLVWMKSNPPDPAILATVQAALNTTDF